MAYGLVVVGGSKGGLHTVASLLSGLPGEFPLPLAVTLHRGQGSSGMLMDFLQRSSVLKLKEAEDKEYLLPGHVYVAPHSYHLLVEKDSLALSTEAPVSWARPSIDVLFESAAGAWAERTIGVLLTGSNTDGAAGLALIHECGGLTVVQDPAEAESRRMPDAAILGAKVDHILPVAQIASMLCRMCCAPVG